MSCRVSACRRGVGLVMRIPGLSVRQPPVSGVLPVLIDGVRPCLYQCICPWWRDSHGRHHRGYVREADIQLRWISQYAAASEQSLSPDLPLRHFFPRRTIYLSHGQIPTGQCSGSGVYQAPVCLLILGTAASTPRDAEGAATPNECDSVLMLPVIHPERQRHGFCCLCLSLCTTTGRVCQAQNFP